MLRFFLSIALLCSPALVFAHAASPDASFGSGGWKQYDLSDLGNGVDQLHTLGPAHGGGYLGLASLAVDAVDEHAIVLHLDDDGSVLDATDSGVPRIYVDAAAVAPDGQTLTQAGFHVLSDGRRAVRLLRWRDGTRDPTFGSHGEVILSHETYWLRASALFVHVDGRMLVAGSLSEADDVPGEANNTFIAALRPNGTLDPDFGFEGLALINILANGYETISALRRETDGTIFLCGNIVEAGQGDAIVTRLGSNGFIDPGFGNQGTARYDSSAAGVDWSERCTAIVRHPDSQRLQIAIARNNGVAQPGTVRVFSVSPTGAFNTFVDAVSGAPSVGDARIAIDGDGRILVSSVVDDPDGDRAIAIARLASTLQPDLGFAPGGLRRYVLFDPDAGVFRRLSDAPSLFVDRGRIVAGVNVGEMGVDTRWAILRLEGAFVFESGFESP